MEFLQFYHECIVWCKTVIILFHRENTIKYNSNIKFYFESVIYFYFFHHKNSDYILCNTLTYLDFMGN